MGLTRSQKTGNLYPFTVISVPCASKEIKCNTTSTLLAPRSSSDAVTGRVNILHPTDKTRLCSFKYDVFYRLNKDEKKPFRLRCANDVVFISIRQPNCWAEKKNCLFKSLVDGVISMCASSNYPIVHLPREVRVAPNINNNDRSRNHGRFKLFQCLYFCIIMMHNRSVAVIAFNTVIHQLFLRFRSTVGE